MHFGGLAWEPIYYSFYEKTNSELCLRIQNASFNLLLISPPWWTQYLAIRNEWGRPFYILNNLLGNEQNTIYLSNQSKYLYMQIPQNWGLIFRMNLLELSKLATCLFRNKSATYASSANQLQNHTLFFENGAQKTTYFLGHMGEGSKTPSYWDNIGQTRTSLF